eukprot:SAG11_NODE_8040_length_1066_cov_1.288521_3_plen_105_part_00
MRNRLRLRAVRLRPDSCTRSSDKHLSWRWAWAEEMVQLSKELNFPFMAGSSLPVAWRMPAVDMPYGAEVTEAMSVAYGGIDSYDFHGDFPPARIFRLSFFFFSL